MLKKIALVDKDEEYATQFKKIVEIMSNDFTVFCYSNLTDFMLDKKDDNFDAVLVDCKIKTKCKNYLKLSETLDDDNHIFKYKKITLILNDIYKFLNKDKDKEENINVYNEKNDNLYILYDASETKNTKRCRDKLMKALSFNEKCFVWNSKMFTNDEYEEGMDIVGALYNNSVLDKYDFSKRLKLIDKQIYGFYNVKDFFEYIEFTDNDIDKIYNKIISNDYKKIFVYMSGDIKKNELYFIRKSQKVYLIYEQDDCIKKNNIKNFLDKYIVNNKINSSTVEFNVEPNERKEQIKIASMVELTCTK